MRIGRPALVVLCLACAASPEAAWSGELKAGAASAEFALPRGVPLAGYSRRKGRPSTGTHDPVGAHALVLTTDRRAIALVSLDVLIVDEALSQAIRDRVLRGGRVDPTATMLIAATHTHSGPGAYGRRFLEKISMGHYDPEAFDGIVEAAAMSVERAVSRLAPASIVAARAELPQLIQNRMDPRGRTDPAVQVLGVYPSGANDPLALVVNFSAHPTSLGSWNRQLSADYPGAARRAIAERFPNAVVLFFAGAVADQAPAKSGDAFERAERIGRPIAAAALGLLEHMTPETGEDIEAVQRTIPLPPAKARLSTTTALPGWMSRRLVDDDATLTLAAVGGIAFIGVPCDLSSELGLELKEAARAAGWTGMIVGFADDYIGYCLPSRWYDSGAYEALMSFNGPTTGPLIVEELKRMMDEVIGDRAGNK
ncbi:MAG: neutral/alkaline non-lysosomal ceramidase N-terminal domain-containing protein [Candidatus Omnitrophica bacterium]|nr:neutral/alkaline non-lysosomal ceramidase N-terminal domain-containing protein [Candidatus Omnitrophota bacterium]